MLIAEMRSFKDIAEHVLLAINLIVTYFAILEETSDS